MTYWNIEHETRERFYFQYLDLDIHFRWSFCYNPSIICTFVWKGCFVDDIVLNFDAQLQLWIWSVWTTFKVNGVNNVNVSKLFKWEKQVIVK